MPPMNPNKVTTIETPYEGITKAQYQNEKRRLQLELLHIQNRLIEEEKRLVVVFEGRDAAGKGSTIKRFIENLNPAGYSVIAHGIPTPEESKNWFERYQRDFPQPGKITFFDRSWYTRALIEPTMGYCTQEQYEDFMAKVLDWEHARIAEGHMIVKFYLSVDRDTQLYRFEDRLNNPLVFWKFSENDLKARDKWEDFTGYKEQMLARTSSPKSPWVVVGANKKREARLTAMLHLVRVLGRSPFQVLTNEDVTKTYKIEVGGVKFRGLSLRQYSVLEEIKHQETHFINLK